MLEDPAINYAENTIAVGDKDFLLEVRFKAGAGWEAEREKSVSIEDAKQYVWEWLNKKDLLDVVLDHEDVWLLMADFANTNPTKNK